MEHTEKQVFSYADISASFWTYKLFPMNVILWFFFLFWYQHKRLVFSFFSSSICCCFLWYQFLTGHRLIQHKCWRWSPRVPCELPQPEMVLVHIPDIGQQSLPAGSSQLLAWACWGKISLFAPENFLLYQPPAERKKPGWKRSRPHVKLYQWTES